MVRTSSSSILIDHPFDVTCEDLEMLMQKHHHQDGLQELQRKFAGIHGLEKKLRTNLRTGLNGDRQDLKIREEIFGRNQIREESSKSFLSLIFKAMQDVTLIILIICALISFGLTFYPHENQSKHRKSI